MFENNPNIVGGKKQNVLCVCFGGPLPTIIGKIEKMAKTENTAKIAKMRR